MRIASVLATLLFLASTPIAAQDRPSREREEGAEPEADPATERRARDEEPAASRRARDDGHAAARRAPDDAPATARPARDERPAADGPARPRAQKQAARAERARRERPCLSRAVEIARYHSENHAESERLRLTRCDGTPNLEALDRLTVLARPGGMERPSDQAIREYRRATRRRREPADADYVVEGLLRLDAGLLVRLQRLAEEWPRRKLTIVSGYRPSARRSSRHRVGRALDVRVEGVDRRQVVAFARTLDETGVGYYPNSHFTHIDVRDRQAYWVDRSGPGERPDYGRWPPPQRELDEARDQALAAIRDLRIDFEE